VATSLTDYLSGLYAAFGAVMAVMVSRQTGRGQVVDAALAEAALSMLEPHIPAYDKLGVIANRAGSKLPDNVPNALFPTRDASFVHIATVGEPVWRRLAAAIGHHELTEDSRFRTAPDRAAHEEELDRIITAWTTAHDVAEIEGVLQAADVPATRIYTVADIFRDPHFAARQALTDAPDRELGSIKTANVVPRLSVTPGRVRHAGAGVVGGDTRSVLREMCGLTDPAIDALCDSGVIVCADRPGDGKLVPMG
jgi:crotonobetainyl-CoA:carnitine CoA-transferase CaiB-like acyl-CoA transferase